ncbi:MAG: ABC transporter permease [Bacteroidota bacterium]|nr:ABC transporter permease [Bacteroidota bacterium]
MIKNYFKLAWRNLWKNKTFSIINIAGLSIGVSCFLLIALYVLDELNYDRYNVHAKQIYRIDDHVKFGDFSYEGAQAPAIMGPAFKKDYPQVEQYARLKNYSDFVIKKGSENLKEDKGAYADSTLFDVFTLPMIEGDPKTALTEPHSLVITKSTAKKYFNTTDVIGKTLTINDTNNYKITGVIKDIPEQSHFNFDFFFPMIETAQSRDGSWFNYNFHTYLLVKPGTDARRLEGQLNKTLMAGASPQFAGTLNISKDEFEKAGNSLHITLRPLTDIHLHSNIADELDTNGSIQYVYIFLAIAIFILMIACVNFMNLSTARSSNRAKEVGVRKVLGSLRNNLMMQFLVESVFISLLSFLLAIGVVLLVLPFFNELAGKNIRYSLLLNPLMVSGILVLMIAVGLIAGSYPAFFLSSFRPIEVLKGNLSRGFKGSFIRNALVVFQFSISIILMIGTVVIFNQLNYIRNKNLGFNKEQVLILKNTYALNSQAKAFRNELLQMRGVKNATISGFLPVSGNRGEQGFVTSPVFDGKNFTIMQQWAVDENYIPTLQIHLKSGRNFSPEFPSDSDAVVINEAAAKILGNGNPINKKLYEIKNLKTGNLLANNIIGVISNFNFNSLHEKVTPLVLKLRQDNGSIAVRVNTADITGLLMQIKSKWKTMVPSQPFSYSFLDEEFAKQYNTEQRTGTISMIFSILAILIACLGLFGLVTYAAEQRVKEIGIRKILGAAIPDIMSMLSKDFVKLILISICIASPVAWWMMNRWLQDFAYRVNISWWIFVVIGLLVLIIALMTSIFQTIKAAIANPVKSLRSE